MSLSIDGNRDDKIAPIILETANKIADSEDTDSVDAIRRVMKTMPIFQMQPDGYLYELEPDSYANEVFATSNSHRLIVNKDRLFDYSTSDKSYDIIIKADILKNNGINTSAPVYMKKAKTYMDRFGKKGNDDNKKEDEYCILITKLMAIIDIVDYSAKLLKSFGFELTYDGYVDILNKDQNLSDGIGLTGDQLAILVSEKYIKKQLLSFYIECKVK